MVLLAGRMPDFLRGPYQDGCESRHSPTLAAIKRPTLAMQFRQATQPGVSLVQKLLGMIIRGPLHCRFYIPLVC